MEIIDLLDKELNAMIIKMFKELGRRIDEHSEKLEVSNKKLENIKKNKIKLKYAITEIKCTLEGIDSILDDTEKQISKRKEKVVEITEVEQKEENRILKNEDSFRDHLENISCTNIHIIGVPKEEERVKGAENIFEDIIAKTSLT